MAITDSAGAKTTTDLSQNITDSTRQGFQKTSEVKTLDEAKTQDKTSAKEPSVPRLDDVAREVKQITVTKQDEIEAAKSFKLLLNSQLKMFEAKDFHAHNMLFYRYDAKDKDNIYDKSPLVFVLRKSKGYVLGLNLHWCSTPQRLILIKYILQMNKQNIRQNLPLNITYAILKPVIQKLGLSSVIRLYIFSRISRRGLVVPPEFWMQAAKLKSESFSGGYSADQLYKMALSKTKEWKSGRKRGQSLRSIR